MKAKKRREDTAADLAAKQKYGGMTRRQYNAVKGRHANFKTLRDYTDAEGTHAEKMAREKNRTGNFEIVALFDGKFDKPDKDYLPNLAAAIARFQKLSPNPFLRGLRLVENVPLLDNKGNVTNGTRPITWLAFQRGDFQQFVNSKATPLLCKKGDTALFTNEAVKKSTALMQAAVEGKLEIVKYQYEGGKAWWETHR